MNNLLKIKFYSDFLAASFILFSTFILCSCRISKPVPIVQKGCDSLFFDLETGMINAVSPLLPQMDIKEWFPCSTRSTADGAPKDCGGGVFYDYHGFNYYTYLDFVEVTGSFKGKITSDINLLTRQEVHSAIKDSLYTESMASFPSTDFFVKPYGCLTIHYAGNKVANISAHFNDCSSITICGNK